jgi:hypothetical protein
VRSVVLRLGLVAAALLGGCGDGTSAEEGSIADLYSAAIRWLVEDGSEGESPAPERVFIEAVGEEGIPLEVQAEVVTQLKDVISVRFIDAREEAIVFEEPGDPIREDGVLLGLGDVPDIDRSPVRLYADRYRDVYDVVAYELLLERRGGTWQVTGEPREVRLETDRGLDG